MVVTLDVLKLSDWLNADALCRGSKGGIRCGARCRPGGRRWRLTAVHAACRRGLGYRLGAGHGEERTRNMPCMVVTLEVSKLSGWSNADARCRESKGGHTMRRPGGARAAGDGGARSVQGRARLQIGGRPRGGAHEEHAVHVCDVGGVKTQRRVEVRRVLRCQGGEGGGRIAWGEACSRSVRGGPRWRFDGSKLTLNIWLMFVTPEVSHLEMSSSMFKPEKSPFMSEMAETSQLAMGPYVSMAEAALALNSLTAALRETLLAK
eukprot:scaffold31350_cov49-Phaeocystis_antarctica.AAC.3